MTDKQLSLAVNVNNFSWYVSLLYQNNVLQQAHIIASFRQVCYKKIKKIIPFTILATWNL